jgi:hypothetical protein
MRIDPFCSRQVSPSRQEPDANGERMTPGGSYIRIEVNYTRGVDPHYRHSRRRRFAARTVCLQHPIYRLTYNQLNKNLISQATIMKLSGLPNGMLTNLNLFAPVPSSLSATLGSTCCWWELRVDGGTGILGGLYTLVTTPRTGHRGGRASWTT